MCYYIVKSIYVEVFKELHIISSPEKKNLVLLLNRKISVQNVGNPTLFF